MCAHHLQCCISYLANLVAGLALFVTHHKYAKSHFWPDSTKVLVSDSDKPEQYFEEHFVDAYLASFFPARYYYASYLTVYTTSCRCGS